MSAPPLTCTSSGPAASRARTRALSVPSVTKTYDVPPLLTIVSAGRWVTTKTWAWKVGSSPHGPMPRSAGPCPCSSPRRVVVTPECWRHRTDSSGATSKGFNVPSPKWNAELDAIGAPIASSGRAGAATQPGQKLHSSMIICKVSAASRPGRRVRWVGSCRGDPRPRRRHSARSRPRRREWPQNGVRPMRNAGLPESPTPLPLSGAASPSYLSARRLRAGVPGRCCPSDPVPSVRRPAARRPPMP